MYLYLYHPPHVLLFFATVFSTGDWREEASSVIGALGKRNVADGAIVWWKEGYSVLPLLASLRDGSGVGFRKAGHEKE